MRLIVKENKMTWDEASDCDSYDDYGDLIPANYSDPDYCGIPTFAQRRAYRYRRSREALPGCQETNYIIKHKYDPYGNCETVPNLYEELRNLTNVCASMRDEIGAVFWQDVELYADMETLRNGELREFLERRPRMHDSIKRLRVIVSHYEIIDGYEVPRLHSQDNIVGICAYLAQVLILDRLEVKVSIQDAKDTKFFSPDDPFASLKPLALLSSKVPVTVTWGDTYFEYRFTDAVEKKWKPMLEAMLNANRAAKEKVPGDGEKDKYLTSRLECLDLAS